ncbi:hypothetical protein AVEN_42772-1 [Araneus ventricosus]|uniref:Uncharacterized protein n=1 Tax=Araneus ventricosus TaxID=182803 RepID=A0A4Y2AG62_ARAVE|nr:hypothetical protein AVEN_42772-1 [Araneus ventricosus]
MKRIWIVDHPEAPVPRVGRLGQAEESHGTETGIGKTVVQDRPDAVPGRCIASHAPRTAAAGGARAMVTTTLPTAAAAAAGGGSSTAADRPPSGQGAPHHDRAFQVQGLSVRKLSITVVLIVCIAIHLLWSVQVGHTYVRHVGQGTLSPADQSGVQHADTHRKSAKNIPVGRRSMVGASATKTVT